MTRASPAMTKTRRNKKLKAGTKNKCRVDNEIRRQTAVGGVGTALNKLFGIPESHTT